ncbi:MAG TPA: hypothetical protein VGN12_23310 [Pirellulales bacterium]|jgi:hypothetical protein
MMRRACHFVLLNLALALTVAAICAAQANEGRAQEPKTPPEGAPLRFRRVYAPAERVQDWPRGAARYVPVEGEEFERLLKAAQAQGENGPPAAALARAEYTAQFDGTENLRGSLAWEVERSGETSAWIPIEALNLAIDSVRWSDSPAPVEFGLGEGGAAMLLANRSGTVTGTWSLRSRRDSDGQFAFRFELPGTGASTMLLTVPPGVVPTAGAGLTTLVEQQDTRHIYRILLGSAADVTLRIPDPATATSNQPSVLLRESSVYDLSMRGLDLVTVWKLDVHSTPVRQITLSLDPGLQLVSARLGETDVPFTTSADTGQTRTQVVLQLADALSGSDRPLRLSAIGTLPADNKPFSLPRIHATNVTWQEGTCTLLVHEPMEVRRLNPHDSRQTKYSLLPEPNRGESFEVQLFSDESAVELELARAKSRVHVSTGLNLELGEDAAQAELLATAHVLQGRRSTLAADLGADWVVDTVESTPREAPSDWRVETGEESAQLVIRPSRPLSADTPCQFVIHGHRPGHDKSVGRWQSDELNFLRFRDVELDEQLFSLHAAAGYGLAISDLENMARVDPRAMDFTQQELFSEPPNDVYRVDPAGGRFTASIEPERPTFAAKIVGTTSVDASTIVETNSIRCQTQDDPIDRLVVHFSTARPEPPRFRIVGAGEGALSARRLNGEKPPAQTPEAGETWEIVLARPQNAAFEIVAERSTAGRDLVELSLVSLNDVSVQQAQVVVEAAADVGLFLRTSKLTRFADVDDPMSPTTRGAFQYAPGDPTAKIEVVRDALMLVPPVAGVVGSRRLESHFDVAGRAWHSATFTMRSAGQASMTLSVPDGCTLTRLWLNGQPYPEQGPQRARILLPVDQANITVVAEYRADKKWRLSTDPLVAPMPEINLPIVDSQWLLWLPPSYDLSIVAGGSCELVPDGVSWGERIFGPLARGDATQPLALFSPRSWSSLVQRTAPATRAAASELAVRFASLSRPTDEGPAPVEWSALLTAAQVLASEKTIRIVVDGPSLAAAGIGPRTPLGTTVGESPIAGRPNLLERANLTLLYSQDVVLLTSRLSALVDRDQISWIEPGVLGILLPGPLQLSLTASAGKPAVCLDAADWARDGLEPNAIEVGAPAFDHDGDAGVPFLIRSADKLPPTVRAVYRPSRDIWRAASCVLALAACLCFVRRRTILLSVLVCAVALTLVTPEALVPWSTGALWGTTIAFAWQWLKPRTPPRVISTSSSASASRRLVEAAPVALVVVLSLGFVAIASLAVAQQAAKPALREEAADIVHRVFIPVDEKEMPTKDKYQIPEQLYDELQRRAADTVGSGQGWLIRGASYQLSFNRDATGEGFVTSDVRAQYDVLALRADVVFRLPTVGVRPVATREGREVDLEWDTDEDGFFCQFEEPGLYRLELSLRTQRSDSTAGSFEMPIPPVPHNSLVVQMPAGMPTVEIPTAYGASQLSDDGRTLTAQLGPASRLSLRWARSRQSRGTNVAGDANLWLWLQIQPASVVLHARLDIKGLKAPLSELWLSVDPRLRALPVVDRSGTVVSVQSLPGDSQTVRVELTRPVTDHVTIPLSFLLVGSSGIGQLSLPRIEPQGVKVVSRVLALSVEPALQFEIPPADPTTAVNITEFLTHWGGAPAPPQSVVQLTPDQAWTIATRPRGIATVAKQRLLVGVGEARATVTFEAQIAPAEGQSQTAGYILQHRVQAPADLDIEKLTVLQDGIDRVSRWTREETGTITVFLTGPVTGRQQLAIEGWLPAPRLGEWLLPRFEVESASRRETSISLCRRPSVQVVVEALTGLAETERSARPTDDIALPGRLVASFVSKQDEYDAKLRITPNAPHVRSSLIATIKSSGNGAEGQIEYRAMIDDGSLDTIAIDLPAVWTGPFEITPASPWEVVTEAVNIRRLIVRPKTPIEGEFQFSLRSPLQFDTSEPVSPPTLVQNEGEVCNSYLVLPAQWGNERLRWSGREMQADRLPEGSVTATPASGWQVFRVDGPDAAAWSAASIAASSSAPGSAVVHWMCGQHGDDRGVVSFVVNGSDEQTLSLRMPDGAQVWGLRVGDRIVTPSRGNDGWEIQIDPREGPQEIEVAFEITAAEETRSGPRKLQAPSLDGADIGQTTWFVYSSGFRGAAQLISSDEAVPVAPSGDALFSESKFIEAAFGNQARDRFDFAGLVPAVTIRFPTASQSGVGLHWGAAILLVVVAVAIGRRTDISQRETATIGLALIGVAVGLLAADWLQPTWLGSMILIASAGLILWPKMREWRDGIRQSASESPAS